MLVLQVSEITAESSACGTAGRVIASHSTGPVFESNLQPFLYNLYLFTGNSWKVGIKECIKSLKLCRKGFITEILECLFLSQYRYLNKSFSFNPKTDVQLQDLVYLLHRPPTSSKRNLQLKRLKMNTRDLNYETFRSTIRGSQILANFGYTIWCTFKKKFLFSIFVIFNTLS